MRTLRIENFRRGSTVGNYTISPLKENLSDPIPIEQLGVGGDLADGRFQNLLNYRIIS
jgi:hypothetical protein